MTKTLVITAIALVAVVMGLSVMAPAVLQQAEAHSAGRIKHHCIDDSLREVLSGDECSENLRCVTANGPQGLPHALDRNGDGIHQHDGTEPEFCLPIREGDIERP